MKKVLTLGLVLALIAAYIKKMAGQREAEWHGLTEEEARSKLDEKLPSRIPEEKREMISDKVVAKMRDRGVIGDADESEGVETAATAGDDEAVDLRGTAAHAAEAPSA